MLILKDAARREMAAARKRRLQLILKAELPHGNRCAWRDRKAADQALVRSHPEDFIL